MCSSSQLHSRNKLCISQMLVALWYSKVSSILHGFLRCISRLNAKRSWKNEKISMFLCSRIWIARQRFAWSSVAKTILITPMLDWSTAAVLNTIQDGCTIRIELRNPKWRSIENTWISLFISKQSRYPYCIPTHSYETRYSSCKSPGRLSLYSQK